MSDVLDMIHEGQPLRDCPPEEMAGLMFQEVLRRTAAESFLASVLSLYMAPCRSDGKTMIEVDLGFGRDTAIVANTEEAIKLILNTARDESAVMAGIGDQGKGEC